MSPLVRSLLALAALLAAAVDAQNNCVTVIVGQTSNYPKELGRAYAPLGHSYLQVNDYCDPPLHLVGEKVTVCNQTPNLPPPKVTPPTWPALSPVDIYCYDPAQCTVDTTEYCDY